LSYCGKLMNRFHLSFPPSRQWNINLFHYRNLLSIGMQKLDTRRLCKGNKHATSVECV
jgi:hypothetical protein